MAKDPAFLFYSQDFIVGVQTMDFEERGKYITILALMHQQGRMKEETIRFLVGYVSDNLKSKFSVDENSFWYNKRLEDEAEKRKKFTESRRINGLQGGRPKKNKKPSGLHMGNHMGNENENENKDINKKGGMGGNRFKPPTVDEVAEYVSTRSVKIDPKRFIDHYTANGWKVGRNSMKDWKAAVRTWEARTTEQPKESKESLNFTLKSKIPE
jgi:hypothetical protein